MFAIQMQIHPFLIKLHASVFFRLCHFRTFVLGYGSAPSERVSLFIAILACIGLGIPLLLLIIGGVYLAVKRMRNC